MNPERRETLMIFNEGIVAQAATRVREAIKVGETLERLSLEVGEAHLIISSDPNSVVGSVEFEVEGNTFYLGFSTESVQE